MLKFKDYLRRLNSLPFSLTIKHYYVFDRATPLLKDEVLNSAESWDVLRQSDPHFSISSNRDEWLAAAEMKVKKDGQDGGLKRRAEDVVKIIDQLNIGSVFSAGVGGAGLEYQIKKMRLDLKLTCSEYSPVAVERLKKVFLECDSIIPFDIKTGDWRTALVGVNPKYQLCLLYRVDIHFTDEELRSIFKHLSDVGVENVLVILCGQLTFRGLINRLIQRLKWRFQSKKYVFAGYLRSRGTFPKFWQPQYTATELDCGGLKSFLLKRPSKL